MELFFLQLNFYIRGKKMEIKYFKETYDEKYGSVFEVADVDAMVEAEEMEDYKIMSPKEVAGNLADYKNDDAFKAFMSSVKKADEIVVFMNDGLYSGDLACVYEILVK